MGSSMWGDKKKAYKYYLMAAKQGSGVAQYNVCVFHYNGSGGARKSNKIAKEWCQKAVDGGYSKASSLLERVKQD
jgi:TPR repeat protein